MPVPVRRIASLCVLLALLSLAASGCHQERGRPAPDGKAVPQTGRTATEQAPPATTLPAPELERWQPPEIATGNWQLAYVDYDIGRVEYRVPIPWTVQSGGRSMGPEGLVRGYVELAPATAEVVSRAAYAAQLAGEAPVGVYNVPGQPPMYIVERRVSLAPADVDAPTYVFHTALLELAGRIVRLEFRYESATAHRFADVSRAALATARVIPAPPHARDD